MKDLHILALETSGPLCRVALLTQRAGRIAIECAEHAGVREHAQAVLPLVDTVLARAGAQARDLDAVAFGRGPGGFTGLRVACAVAQGLAVALDVPVLPVDSLWAIAVQEAGDAPRGVHLVVQDARMQELYVGAYRAVDDQWLVLQEPVLMARDDLIPWVSEQVALWQMQAGTDAWAAHGDGLACVPGLPAALAGLGAQCTELAPDAAVSPQASSIARLGLRAWHAGEALDAAQATPAYVRDKVAFTTRERAAGHGGNPRVAGVAPSLHPMRPSDVPEIVAIERQVQAFPWTWNHFIDGLGAGNHGWIVRRLGALQGYALLLDTPDMAHLLVIGVHPQAQRQGIGSRLIQQCVRHCQATRIPALTLEVRPSNTNAIHFYRHHGFTQTGLRRGYYPAPHNQREDGWIMTRPVSEAAA